MKPILLAAMLLLCFDARAADWVLASDAVEVRPGDTVTVDVVYAGAGAAKLPDRLPVRANARSRSWVLEMNAGEPQQGVRRRYTLGLPAGASGVLVLDLAREHSSKLALVARGSADAVARLVVPRAAAAESADSQAAGAAPADGHPPTEPILSVNEPMYFLLGNRQGLSARYQLSFKYRFFDDDSGLGRARPWLSGLYFGYTQNSFWDLSGESRPFRDTSYRPSVYYQLLRPSEKAWMESARIGFEHESNGKDGVSSRSINSLFVQPAWRVKADGHRSLVFDPKFQAYFNKDENADIANYRGHVDWRLRYGREDGFVATSTVRVGTSGRGSVQVDASYPLRDERIGEIGGYWHLQYFNGYGEDILGYNQKRDAQLRIGFSIVR